jgi:CHASE2 domain-containing sensor protein
VTQERMVGEAVAAAGTAGSWVLVGFSLTVVNQVLTAVSLIAATCASIAAFVYYRRKHREP